MSHIQPISMKEFREGPSKFLWIVFNSFSPQELLFQDSVTHKGIFEWDRGWELEPVQLEAVVAGAKAVGDEGMYWSFVDDGIDINKMQHYGISDKAETHDPWHFYIPLTHFADYFEVRRQYRHSPLFAGCNALYSLTGKWGLTITTLETAAVGGNQTFFEAFNAKFPIASYPQYLRRAIRAWKLSSPFWFKKKYPFQYLSNIIGAEKARQALAEFDYTGEHSESI